MVSEKGMLISCWQVLQALPEPQWLKVDIRTFDMTVLGKFGVIMADPPVSTPT